MWSYNWSWLRLPWWLLWKREAEPYTIGQVAAGLPIHNAFATGHPHNVGVVAGYGYGYYGYHGGYYGKREAEPYTIG